MKVAFVSYDFGQYCIRHANGLSRECEVLLLLREQVAAPLALEISPAVRCRSVRCPQAAPALAAGPDHVLSPSRDCRLHTRTWSISSAGHLWFNLALPLLRKFPLVVTLHDVRHHPGDARDRGRHSAAIMNIAYRRADQIIVHGSGSNRRR